MKTRGQGHCFTFDPGLSIVVSNIYSKATGPIVTKLHIELNWPEGRKVYSNSLGHMTNMAAMPIYGKILYKYSSLESVD